MLPSKHDRFSWSRQDRALDESFFRLLRQNWRPVVREVVVVEDHNFRYGRAATSRSMTSPPARPFWSPWLWIAN